VRPVVGITTYVEQVRWGPWDTPAALVPHSYVRAVERAGGRPLLVPPAEDAVEETLEALDALVLSGGSDLEPSLYGADRHDATVETRPERDRAEIALLRAALERDLPVLAICRGLQVMNVARGGDLVQHLPEIVGSEVHKERPGVFGEHHVTLRDGSRLAAILGDRAPVPSHHHQGPGRLGAGLEQSAWAEDGTIEALEDPARRFALGVLWHPEQREDGALFDALVTAARDYRGARTS
jgi:putative glutamine amidotransferase